MAAMAWQTTGDVTEFLAAAGPYLRRERARNTVILSVTETMRVNAAASAGKSSVAGRAAAIRRRPAAAGRRRPLFGWWSDPAGAVAGAFMHTPPFPVVLTAVAPEAAAELAAVTMAARPVGGVNAYPEVAEAFADGWRSGHRGGRVGRLPPPAAVPAGGAGLAGPGAGRGGQARPRCRRAADGRLVRRLRRRGRRHGQGRGPVRRRAREDQPRRGHGLGGGRRARRHRLQHGAGARHGPDRPGLHPAGAARPRLRQRGHRGALAAPARGGGARRSSCTPTSPIRCPIRSTSASATGRSKTGSCWRFRPISYRLVILRSPARAAYLKALCYLPGRFSVTFRDPLPLLPDTSRHRRTGLVPA